jgi:hypothetical protein
MMVCINIQTIAINFYNVSILVRFMNVIIHWIVRLVCFLMKNIVYAIIHLMLFVSKCLEMTYSVLNWKFFLFFFLYLKGQYNCKIYTEVINMDFLYFFKTKAFQRK